MPVDDTEHTEARAAVALDRALPRSTEAAGCTREHNRAGDGWPRVKHAQRRARLAYADGHDRYWANPIVPRA